MTCFPPCEIEYLCHLRGARICADTVSGTIAAPIQRLRQRMEDYGIGPLCLAVSPGRQTLWQRYPHSQRAALVQSGGHAVSILFISRGNSLNARRRRELRRWIASYHTLHVAGCESSPPHPQGWQRLTRARSSALQQYWSHRRRSGQPLHVCLRKLLAIDPSNDAVGQSHGARAGGRKSSADYGCDSHSRYARRFTLARRKFVFGRPARNKKSPATKNENCCRTSICCWQFKIARGKSCGDFAATEGDHGGPCAGIAARSPARGPTFALWAVNTLSTNWKC